MKKLLSLIVILSMLLAFAACGEEGTLSKGLEFTSNGDDTCYVSGIGKCTDTEIVIPVKTPFGDKVTGIGKEAFENCEDLKSITIQKGVTNIGRAAFYFCTGLTDITIPSSVTSIGACAFEFCVGLTSITIPNGVKSIEDFTLSGCTRLTSITIPMGVTIIGDRALYFCACLTSINYQGTRAQWNDIEKGEDWDKYTGNYTIHCTDGDITK